MPGARLLQKDYRMLRTWDDLWAKLLYRLFKELINIKEKSKFDGMLFLLMLKANFKFELH